MHRPGSTSPSVEATSKNLLDSDCAGHALLAYRAPYERGRDVFRSTRDRSTNAAEDGS